MIEIFQILLFYLIFSFSLFVPINIFKPQKFLNTNNYFENATFNLGITISILLIISYLNISLTNIQKYIVLIYFVLFLYLYFKNFKTFLKFYFNLIPIFIVFFVISISVANNLKLGWDAKSFYYINSLFFFENKTLYNFNEFHGHHYHPYLGSYLWAFFRNLSFLENEYFGRLFYVFIFSSSIYYICQIPNNKKISFAYLIILVSIFFSYEFFSGLQEILIFSYLMIISKYFYNLINIKKNIYLIFIITYLNLIFWTKLEGIIYFSTFILILLFMFNFNTKIKLIIVITFISLISIKPIIYSYYGLNLHAQAEYSFEYLKNIDLSLIFYQLKNILIWFIYYSVNNIFFIFGVGTIIFTKIYTKKDNFYFNIQIVYLFFIINFIIWAYIFRNMEIIYAIRTTMGRLIMTASGFFVFSFVLISYKNLLNKFKFLK